MSVETADQYCSNCGASLSDVAEYCPECGAGVSGPSSESDKTRISERGYTITGVVSGLIALILFPPVFGITSILAGVQLFRHHDERYGIAIMVWGGVALVSGVLIGAVVWTS